MPVYRFVTLDVFTDRPFGGNQLAVFPDAEGLTGAQMQALATELNLAETTFVLPPQDPSHTARVRIFTAAEEMPFAGHPNVGTGFVLAGEGRDRAGGMVFEELAGLVEIRIDRDGAGAVTGAEIAAPQPLATGATFTAAQLAACLGIGESSILTQGHLPVMATVGVGFLVVEVTADGLAKVAPNLAACQALEALIPATDIRLAIHLYVRSPAGLRVRMFSTAGGRLTEDAATGSANATLGALLLSLTSDDRAAYNISQGVEMGRPSLLKVTARRTPEGIRATVGGGCVPMFKGEVTL